MIKFTVGLNLESFSITLFVSYVNLSLGSMPLSCQRPKLMLDIFSFKVGNDLSKELHLMDKQDIANLIC